ncbi:MAG: hypothetical protein HY711_01210 [Candidatus Melainabacteria bacterium]|nr:hypothetical protein [Candidatus Melainabacteria bacterium]
MRTLMITALAALLLVAINTPANAGARFVFGGCGGGFGIQFGHGGGLYINPGFGGGFYGGGYHHQHYPGCGCHHNRGYQYNNPWRYQYQSHQHHPGCGHWQRPYQYNPGWGQGYNWGRGYNYPRYPRNYYRRNRGCW